MNADDIVANQTFEEIEIGDSASVTRTLTRDDAALVDALSGGADPTHASPLGLPTARSLWGGALTSAVFGTKLPGPGTICVNQSLQFHRPIGIGETLTTTVTVRAKVPASKSIIFDCESVDANRTSVISGKAEVIAPTEKFVGRLGSAPHIRLFRHEKYEMLIARCQGLTPLVAAVAHPCDDASLSAAIEAAQAGIIVPRLIGPAARIRAVAERLEIDLAAYEINDAPHSHAAAEKAVEAVRAGMADLVMKGSLHTDELLSAVVHKETGLRTKRRVSHCFIMDVPSYPNPLIITDAAINIYPSLEDKADIIRNAIDLAATFGLVHPRIAILSAVETINPKIQTTLDAAALCKMADRGQIRGGILDGPLALDNAISKTAADIKGIVSPIDGQADILVVPDLEAGNMVYKNLSFLADADGAGIVLGARVPIILTSRADQLRTRLASCAVASLYAHAQRASLSTAAE